MTLKRLIRLFLYVSLSSSILLVGFVYAIYKGKFGHVYTIDDIQAFENAYGSEIYSANGDLLGLIYNTNRQRVGEEEIPQIVLDALVVTEDQRYYSHSGIDMKSLGRVAVKNILLGDRSAGGGSTLSQQLAKNMFGRDATSGSSLVISKIKEMIVARRIESLYSKNELLTLYLNTVPFGEDVYGIEAAARRFYSKQASDLNTEQSAVLIGMLKSNHYYNPRLFPEHATSRRNDVLELLSRKGAISDEERDSLISSPIQLCYQRPKKESSGYINTVASREAERIIALYNKAHGTDYDLKQDGLIIETTIVQPLQSIAFDRLSKQLAQKQHILRSQYSGASKRQIVKKNLGRTAQEDESLDDLYNEVMSLHGAFMIMDAQSGAIYAYVGGKDHNKYPFDQIQARRPMASTFKPFLFAEALRSGLSPCDMIDNKELQLNDFGQWSPDNYDKSHGGQVSLSYALAHSLNIPSVRLYIEQDHDSLERTWEAFRFGSKLANKPATALGTTDASLHEVCRAYSSFAARGTGVEPFLIRRITTSEGTILYSKNQGEHFKATTSEIADQMNAMLQMTQQEGTAKALHEIYGVKEAFAVKTGTSQSYSDAWVVAYNSELVFGVRIGANSPAVHFNSGVHGSSTKLALPVLGATINGMKRNGMMRGQIRVGFHEDTPELDCVHERSVPFIHQMFDLGYAKKGSTMEKEVKRIERQRKVNRMVDKLNPFNIMVGSSSSIEK